MYAAENGHTKVANLLIEHGANVQSMNKVQSLVDLKHKQLFI
jgi:ankyrin repeat protein